MKVAVDARWAQRTPHDGVGRAVASTVPLLARSADLTLLTDDRLPPAGLGPPEVALHPPRGPATVWLQLTAPRWLSSHREGIFYCPWYGLPYRLPIPGVATLHDLTFEHRPEWFKQGPLRVFRAQARHAARIGKALLTPSEHVKQDIIRTYRVPDDRIYVAPSAVDRVFNVGATHTQDLPADYVVAIGGAPRRRIDRAVEAWRLAGTGATLVVMGQRDLPPEPGLITLPRISDEEWAGVLAGAGALLYPTEDEGFGLPPLEAGASGTPTVAARVGSVPEVMGDAVAWADSGSPEDLARALRELTSDVRKRAIARAAAAPTWEDCAAVMLRAFERAAES